MDNKNNTENLIELKELIYAPLKAVSDANIKLSTNIVDFLKSTGDMSVDASGKPVIHLKTIQMLYDRLRYDAMDNTVKECIGLEIPLLSILPPSNLKVSKTKISFDAEVRCIHSDEERTKIITRVCPKRESGETFSPNFSYEAELESVSMPEGLASFIETLNAQSIPKKIHSAPIDRNGFKLEGEKLKEYENQLVLKEKENELTTDLEQVSELFAVKNNALKMETGMDFEEYSRYVELSGLQEPAKTFVLMRDYNQAIVSIKEKLDMIRGQIIAYRLRDEDGGIAAGDYNEYNTYNDYENGNGHDGYNENTENDGNPESTENYYENSGDTNAFTDMSGNDDSPLGGFSEFLNDDSFDASDECRNRNVPEYCLSHNCRKLIKCDYAFMKMIEKRKN